MRLPELLAALAALAILATGAEVHARKAIVVMGISGPRGAQAARLVTRALASRYRVVGRGAFVSAAKQEGMNANRAAGRAAAARALGVAAVISGSITRVGGRWALRMAVYSGHNGAQVGGGTFPLRGTRVDPTTAHQVLVGLSREIARTRAGAGARRVASAPRKRPRKARRPRRRRSEPVAVRTLPVPQPAQPRGGFDDGTDLDDAPPPAPAPAPAPAPQPAQGGNGDPVDDGLDSPESFETPPAPSAPRVAEAKDDLGFEVNDDEQPAGDEGEGERRVPSYQGRRTGTETHARVSKKTDERPEWLSILELSVGLIAMSRSFDFNDPYFPADPQKHSNYRSGIVPAIILEGAIYPLAYFNQGPLANLGIVGRYYRVLGLKSQPPSGGEPLRTTLHMVEAGLRYRWNILGRPTSPTLNAGVEFGRLGFVIWDDEQSWVDLPDIAYVYLKLALVGLEVPFYSKNRLRFGAMGSFDYLLIFSAGEIENTDSSGYGRSSTGGIDFAAGLFGSYYGFFAKVSGFYRRVFFDFDNACYPALGCKAAGGALDVYMGGTFLLGYGF